jgi:hypothetical protein
VTPDYVSGDFVCSSDFLRRLTVSRVYALQQIRKRNRETLVLRL